MITGHQPRVLTQQEFEAIINNGTVPTDAEDKYCFIFAPQDNVVITVSNSTSVRPTKRIIVYGNGKTTIVYNASKSYYEAYKSSMTTPNPNAPCICLKNFNVVFNVGLSLNRTLFFYDCNIVIKISNSNLSIQTLLAVKCKIWLDNSKPATQPFNASTTTLVNATFIHSIVEFNRTYQSSTTTFYGYYINESFIDHCILDFLYTRVQKSLIANSIFAKDISIPSSKNVMSHNNCILVNNALNGHIMQHADNLTLAEPGTLCLYNELGNFSRTQDMFYILCQSNVVRTGQNSITYKVIEGIHNTNGTQYFLRNLSGKYYIDVIPNLILNDDGIKSQAVYVRGTPIDTYIGIVKCIALDMPAEEHVLYGYKYSIGLIREGKLVIPEENTVLKEFGQYGYNKVGKLDINDYSKNINITSYKEK